MLASMVVLFLCVHSQPSQIQSYTYIHPNNESTHGTDSLLLDACKRGGIRVVCTSQVQSQLVEGSAEEGVQLQC
jgi:triacylglycerol esterase/lipase EstA (alpha/beta hydrolase family)